MKLLVFVCALWDDVPEANNWGWREPNVRAVNKTVCFEVCLLRTLLTHRVHDVFATPASKSFELHE